MDAAICDPAVHQCFFSVCVCCNDLQCCTAQRLAVLIGFLDLDLCRKVVHPNPHFAGFVVIALDKFALVIQGEVNVLCHTVTVWCRYFMQRVGFARCQNLADDVLCILGSPLVQHIIVLIQDLKHCTRQKDDILSCNLFLNVREFSDCQICLLDVLHDDTLSGSEFKILGKEISLRCRYLMENICFVRIQDGSHLVSGAVCGPFFDNIAALILDLQNGTNKVTTSAVCFQNACPCCIVHHADGYGVFSQGKFHILCGVVTGGGCCFMQGVCFSVDQFSSNHMSGAVCDPFLDHVFVAVQNLHLCTAQRFFVVVIFADLDLCSVVYHL